MVDKEQGNCCCCTEEASEEELLARLDEVIAEYKDKPGALIPVLQMAQAIFGYLPESALRKISLGLNKSYSEVAGVVGFYSFFSTQPRGKHMIDGAFKSCRSSSAGMLSSSNAWTRLLRSSTLHQMVWSCQVLVCRFHSLHRILAR